MRIERVRIGDVLKLQRRLVDLDPSRRYKLIGVYSFGKGIFHREPTAGLDLGNYRFFAIEPGDLVLSNIRAWEGAIAYATDAEVGTIGTHRFLTYTPVNCSVDANWVRWFLLSERGMDLIRRAAPGTAVRNRTLAIDRFESLQIPLPPIAEQQRIAGRLDAAVAEQTKVSSWSARCSVLADAVAVSIASRPDLPNAMKSAQGWRLVPLAEVMQPAIDLFTVDPQTTYPNIGILSFGRGVFEKPPIDGAVTSARSLIRIRAGQFIYSRLFAFEGAYACVPDRFDGYCVSNEFPTFDTDPTHIDARWLATYFRSPERWAELRGSSKGLGLRRQRVPVEAVLAYRIWLPPMPEQRRMLCRIDALESLAERRGRFNHLAAALMPALLNEAFAGMR